MTNRIERGGGWLSGPMHNPLPPAAPANQADDSPVVTEAVEALEDWGGDELTRKTVLAILPTWKHYADLSPKDKVAILMRFPGKGDTR